MQTTLHKNRLVAFIDILGFSQRIQTVPIVQVHTVLSSFVDEAKSRVFFQAEDIPGSPGRKMFNFEVMQFAFDTLILVSSDPASEYSDANFIFACNSIFNSAARFGLALRGAIGVGDVLSDISRDMLLSSSFAHLAKLEKEQEWMGCCLTDEVADRIAIPLAGAPFDFSAHLPVVKYEVPFKKGGLSARYCLNWVATLPLSACNRILESLTEPKKANTVKFANQILVWPTYRQKLEVPAGPVHYFGYTSSRAKAFFCFFDANGEPCDPTEPVTINMTDNNGTNASVTIHWQP